MINNRLFTDEQEEAIREACGKARSRREVTETLNGRFGTSFTLRQVISWMKNNKVRMENAAHSGEGTALWPANVMDFVRENVKGISNAELTERINARFGTCYTEGQVMAKKKNSGITSGKTGRFEKGHIPAYIAPKGVTPKQLAPYTYQKNNIPADSVPVGTVSWRKGYPYVKVRDGHGNRNWRELQRTVYEREKGPIPEGMRVIFLDGNTENLDPSNLAAVTMGEMSQLNRRKRRSRHASVTRANITLTRLENLTKKRKKEKNEHDGK